MVGALVVTHGRLSHELVSAAKKIVGDTPRLHAVSIDWDNDVARARNLIAEGLKAVNRGRGAVILTDMFGGTPTNISLSFLEPGTVEIVTGVNLPMLIKFLNVDPGKDLGDVVEEIKVKGQRAIQIASDLLGQRVAGGKD